MLRVLIVEDEKPIADLISMSLNAEGYECFCVFNGLQAANVIDNDLFDLILLDVMLPEVDGFELMEYIRPKEIPVIFITARTFVDDRVKGLRLGAEDYLLKPFEIDELIARVENVFRRKNKLDRIIYVDKLKIDTFSRTVINGNDEILLTKKEYELLLLFVRNKGIALYRDTIYERVWESDYMGDSRTVDLHVQRLRKKVGWENKIKAVYKVGYRFEE